jgi:hypothetical protein
MMFSELIVLAFVLIALVIGISVYHHRRIKSILTAWSKKNHVQILKMTSGGFRRCPFFFNLGRQEVYYLYVCDRNGTERGCWVRIGDFLGGSLLSDSVEAKWEDDEGNTSNNAL